MNQIRITGKDLRPDDYLAGGIGRGPDPRYRVRRLTAGDLHGVAVVVVAMEGHGGVAARRFVGVNDPVVVWR